MAASFLTSFLEDEDDVLTPLLPFVEVDLDWSSQEE